MNSEEAAQGFSKVTATLRIYGAALKPEEVTRILGVEPTDSWEEGSPGYKGLPRSKGMWMLESSTAHAAAMEEHLSELLSKTSPSNDAWRGLCRRFSCDVFVGAWMDSDNACFSLSPALLEQIGRRGLVLSADLYFIGEDEE